MEEKWGQSNFSLLDQLAWLIVTKKLLYPFFAPPRRRYFTEVVSVIATSRRAGQEPYQYP
jgi:hypothetical protein